MTSLQKKLEDIHNIIRINIQYTSIGRGEGASTRKAHLKVQLQVSELRFPKCCCQLMLGYPPSAQCRMLHNKVSRRFAAYATPIHASPATSIGVWFIVSPKLLRECIFPCLQLLKQFLHPLDNLHRRIPGKRSPLKLCSFCFLRS